jgi:1,2-dihydroxy-3-keto-5-methylthiopentene dioxygenase
VNWSGNFTIQNKEKMALLSIPDLQKSILIPEEIKSYLNEKGIFFDQWKCEVEFEKEASSDEILMAYDKDLLPFMNQGGYQTADVISINSLTENYGSIRAKFLAEHTHTEDEIRFFVDGEGLFWFNLADEDVFNVLCQKGDLISVPAGTKHWFDAGETNPFVKAIRIFIDMSGWVPHYTSSQIEKRYL